MTGTDEALAKFSVLEQPADIILQPGGDTTLLLSTASPNTNPAQVQLSFTSSDGGGSYGTTSFRMFAGDPEEFLPGCGRDGRYIADNVNNQPSLADGTDLGSGEFGDVRLRLMPATFHWITPAIRWSPLLALKSITQLMPIGLRLAKIRLTSQ